MARRTSNNNSSRLIGQALEFHGSNMAGFLHTPGTYLYTGYLPDRFAETLKDATYVVVSYSTPIGWLTPAGWVVPPVSYSVSTAKHQGYVRQAAHGYRHPVHSEWDRELALTKTQRDALARLRHAERLWPALQGRNRLGNETPWTRRTLQALVDAGLARWDEPRDGVMPNIVPA